MQAARVFSPSRALASLRNAWKTGFFHDVAMVEVAHSRRIGPWHAPQ
jgi:hypothetical protein